MKKLWQSTLLLSAGAFLSASTTLDVYAISLSPFEAAKKVEIALSGVYLPPLGFDDNDTVVGVVDGLLPNGCYEQGVTEIEIVPSEKVFRLRQFALRKVDGICAPGQELPPDAAAAVPFTQEVSFGRLDRGHYRIEYTRALGRGERPFSVNEAPVVTIDNIRYPAVSSIYVPEIVSAKDPHFRLLIAGILNSSCVELADTVTVERVEDVIIVLPATKVLFSGACLPVIRNFATEVSIATPPPGRYMVHVRSLNGRAVSRLLTVQ